MNIKQVLFLAAFGLTASATFTSCDDVLGEWSKPAPVTPTSTPTPTTVSVTSITLSETTLNKKVVDAAVTLTATVAPDNADDKTITWSSDKESVATVVDGVVTIVGTGTALITATANDGSGVTAACTVTVLPEGTLAGVFSVSDTKKVRFSQGNLQYQASTKTWRFAENQYDYVGGASNGNVYVESTKSNNASISDTYTGWIDLFGWGTSGHKYDSGYGSDYQPWSTSTTGTNYGPNGTNGLYDSFAQGDWGTNMGTGWRTLKSDEWTYLFNTRSASTVNGTPDARYAKAYLFGTTHGIILFPDIYTHPDGVAAPTGINDETSTYWNANTYSAADWAKMEAAGCVFLPAAGYRNGTWVGSAGSEGIYWSSSPYGSNAGAAYCMLFSSSGLSPARVDYRYYGMSVRLVRPVE